MTNENQMDVLTELLAERNRYETWLAQLEGRRGHAPTHVLERVRSDYAGRLEAVTGQLRGRAVELEQSVASLRSRVQALTSEEDQRRDERAETELRAGVGEFGEDQARTAIAACDEAINALATQREAVSAELAKLQGVLEQILASPSPPPPAAPAEPALEHVERAPHVEPASPRVATPNPIDELEFLRSVVNSPESNRAVPPAAAPSGQPDFLPQPVLAAPRRQVTPLSTAIPSSRPAPSAGGQAQHAVPSFLRDVPTEQVKTLKCAECGTMNSPTEWYCERCGGELAAM
jgi:hypothetical protein